MTSSGIVIAGGGPVGTMLALELFDRGVSVLHVRSESPAADRPIALSYGSRLLLERVRAWPGAPGPTPIEQIHVSQQAGFGRTVISASECGLPALGYVAGYARIVACLSSVRARPPTVEGRVLDWSADSDGVTVHFAGPGGEGNERAGLLVIADGGQTGLPEERRDYGQRALVAEVRSERAHRNIAWERFTSSGPIALLPYADRHALVWSTGADSARSLLDATDAEFLERLGSAFGRRLGRFLSAGARAAFPLALRRGRVAHDARVLLIGNASQTLHPVAGQGLNLGLRDACELARLIGSARPEDIGGADFVRTYHEKRRLDRCASVGLTDALVRIFSNSSAPVGVARGAALAFLDTLPPLRRFFARRMIYGARAWP